MAALMENFDLPSTVEWLIGLHGYGTVRGILGDCFDGLRSGRLDWDEVDAEVREALSQMIEGAILAGMEPPPQARRTEVPPEETGPTQHVVAQDLANQPRELAGNHPAPPTVRETRPNATPSGRRLGGADRSPVKECMRLHSLRIGLEEQLRLGGGEKRLDSFYLAKDKVNLLLERKFGVSRQGNLHLPLSLDSSIKLRHRRIRSREEADRRLGEGIWGPVRKFWAGCCGWMSTEVVIRLVAEKKVIQISEELLQEILSQGRDCCELD